MGNGNPERDGDLVTVGRLLTPHGEREPGATASGLVRAAGLLTPHGERELRAILSISGCTFAS